MYMEGWYDGELEYRIMFTHMESPFPYAHTALLRASGFEGKLACFPNPNS
jgi:hypothetical protein